jgi:hypothetical protein
MTINNQIPPVVCDPQVIKAQWDKYAIKKTWPQKVHAWMSFESAPAYGKKQNLCELAGVILMLPSSLWLGVFLIKHPKEVKNATLLAQKVSAVCLLTVTSPITILGVLIKGLGEVLPHRKIETDDTLKKETHPLMVHACYLMTKKFIDACNEIQFNRFYATAGTLLGAVRHGGYIPWDDDVDLNFDTSDLDFLKQKLKPRIEAQGIVWAENLYDTFKVLKLSFHQDEWKKIVEEFKASNPTVQIPKELLQESPNIIDLCGTSMMADGISWASDSAATRTMFPTDYAPLKGKSEIENPEQYIKFGNMHLPTFSNETIIKYLKTYYGDDCLKYGIQTHSHGSINTRWGRIPLPKFHCTYRFKITKNSL